MAQIQQLIGGLGGEAIGTPPASMHALALHRWIDRNVQETQNGCFCGPRCAGLQGCRMGLPFLKCLPRSSPLGGASPFEWHEREWLWAGGENSARRGMLAMQLLWPCRTVECIESWNDAAKASIPLWPPPAALLPLPRFPSPQHPLLPPLHLHCCYWFL